MKQRIALLVALSTLVCPCGLVAQEMEKMWGEAVVKLRAEDVKGNTGESRTVRITIASVGFISRNMERITAKRKLLTALEAMEIPAARLEKLKKDFRNAFKKDDDNARSARIRDIAAEGGELSRTADEAYALAAEVIRMAEPGAESYETTMLGRTLALVSHTWAAHLVSLADALPYEESRNDLDRDIHNTGQILDRFSWAVKDETRHLLDRAAIDLGTQNTLCKHKKQQRG